jgi:hypothetical protein
MGCPRRHCVKAVKAGEKIAGSSFSKHSLRNEAERAERRLAKIQFIPAIRP